MKFAYIVDRFQIELSTHIVSKLFNIRCLQTTQNNDVVFQLLLPPEVPSSSKTHDSLEVTQLLNLALKSRDLGMVRIDPRRRR